MPGDEASSTGAPASATSASEALILSSSRSSARWFLAAAALSAGLTCFAFHRVLPGYFLGDDFGGIALVRDLGPADLPALFKMYEGQGHYRPGWGIVFWLMHAAFGLDPVLYHACSLLLHALCGFALACLVARVSGSRGVALASAALFVVHPVNGPILGWIASMHDPLWTLGVLVALIAHDRWVEEGRQRFLVAALLAFFFALLVKEPAIAMAPCALVLALVRPGGRLGRALFSVAIFVIASVAYLAVRVATRSLEPGFGSWIPRVLEMGSGAVGRLLNAPEPGPWSRAFAVALPSAALAGLLGWNRDVRLRASCAFVIAWLLLLLPQAPAFQPFTDANARLLYAPLAAGAAAAALFTAALLPWRVRLPAGIAVTVAACVLELVALGPRLEPFVEAGRLSRRYRDELRRVLPEVPPTSRERRLLFVTNLVPLPEGSDPREARFFWPAFDQISLAIVLGLSLPPPLFRRTDLDPGVLLRWISEIPIDIIPPLGIRERGDFVVWLRAEAAKSRVAPDPRLVMLFWDERTRTLERIGNAEVFVR